MIRLVPLVAVWVLALAAEAQPAAYGITPSAFVHADGAAALVRDYDVEYVVDGPGRATQRVRLVMTAFGPAGREAVSRLVVPHGGFRRLRRLDGVLRDASGEAVRELGRRDVQDRAITSVSFQDDLQIREAELPGDAYPYTVEWTYEVEHRGVLSWPEWRPQRSGTWPVEQASFRLSVPSDMPVRTRPQHLDAEPTVTEAGRRTTYAWSVASVPAFEPEPLGPGWQAQTPTLFLGTDVFEIGGTRGRADSWEGLGAWYAQLSEGRTVLPEAARGEVRAIAAGADSQREVVRRLYDHLQRSTRYVSVQLGLGGWQTYDAEYVFERRYGDCKALVNYLQAMLAEVGIAAEPVLIYAGEDAPALDPDFPRNAFNHVILRVELDSGEVIWLECTSSLAAFGHLGAFTEDRDALLVTAAGGRLVRTPRSHAADHLVARTGTVRLDPSGGAEIEAGWQYAGDPRVDVLYALTDRLGSDQERWLHDTAGLAGFDIEAFDLGDLAARPDTLGIGATLRAATFARRAGRRLLIPLRPLAEDVAVPPEADGRVQPVHLGTPYAERDELRLVLPEGYTVEALPEAVVLETAFGRFAQTVTPTEDGTALVVRRTLEVDGAALPPEAYEDVRAFFLAVARADAGHAVIAAES